MKRIFASLMGMTAFLSVAASLALAQAPVAPAPTVKSKIGLVNIAKVLREFGKANERGEDIALRRRSYLMQVGKVREDMGEINKKLAQSNDPKEKETLQQTILAKTRTIEDIDRTAQKELTDLSNNTITQVYSEIKMVVSAVAVNYSLEMILCYPDATTAEEAKSPTVAQLKLQTPALMPFYHSPSMDYTEVVIKTLNSNFPSKAPAAKAPVTAPAMTAPPQTK